MEINLKPIIWLSSLLLLVSIVNGCQSDATGPDMQSSYQDPGQRYRYEYPASLLAYLEVEPGHWIWRWRLNGSSALPDTGRIDLEIRGLQAQWTVADDPWLKVIRTATPVDTLFLIPDQPALWHGLAILWSDSALTTVPPLPRLPVASLHYADLLDLLQCLTNDRFEQTVTHWPQIPIPVRAGTAMCDQVDLAGCLREAVDIWNREAAEPLFVWTATSDWGVRLVHLVGVERHPPLSLKITRLDGYGSPLGANLLAGDNYCSEQARTYAVSGLVHELTHALLLWGHSADRSHVLWGEGPPLVTEPSRDECRAAQLWLRLPTGLDLSQYNRPGGGISRKPSGIRSGTASWPQVDHREGRLSPVRPAQSSDRPTAAAMSVPGPPQTSLPR